MLYVLGFAFSRIDYQDYICLIHKLRGPEEVVGKLNGVGGRFETADGSRENTMVREFHEETGVMTDVHKWNLFGIMDVRRSGASIYCYKYVFEIPVQLVQATDEHVAWYSLNSLRDVNVVPNLRWLIPLAKEKDNVFAHLSIP